MNNLTDSKNAKYKTLSPFLFKIEIDLNRILILSRYQKSRIKHSYFLCV